MLVRLNVVAIVFCMATHARALAADPRAEDAITIVRDISYRDGVSKNWRIDLAMPNGLTGKPRPGIVVVHGGGWLEGDKSSFVVEDRRAPANIVDFAKLGFVSMTINYRLSAEAPFSVALEDCKCAVRWLRAHAKEYNLDREHIGAWGNSAGGHLALLLAMVGRAAELEGDIRRDTPPLLLIYGVSDLQIPIVTADEFVLALGKAGSDDITYHRLAYVDHCPHSLVAIPEMQKVVDDFFVRTLMHPETAKEVRRWKR